MSTNFVKIKKSFYAASSPLKSEAWIYDSYENYLQYIKYVTEKSIWKKDIGCVVILTNFEELGKISILLNTLAI